MKEYKLEYPIKIKQDGKNIVIEEVKLGRAKLKNARKINRNIYSEGDAEKMAPEDYAPLIASMIGIEEEYVEEMDLADYMKLVSMVTEILGEQVASQEVGKK